MEMEVDASDVPGGLSNLVVNIYVMDYTHCLLG